MERLNWDMASKDERRVSSCSFPWRGAGGGSDEEYVGKDTARTLESRNDDIH